MTIDIKTQLKPIIATYNPNNPNPTAAQLRQLWLQFKPKSIATIKAEQRAKQETVGTPVPILKKIGTEISKQAKKQVSDFIPLATLLWHEYGREGRVIALITFGAMELTDPDRIIPLLMELGRSCHTWEDADRLAMDALEPIVRKDPEQWLPVIHPWLDDENKWIRRAAVTVIGRLPMKKPEYTAQCLTLTEQLLFDEETDVKKAVSFAIRLAARGEIDAVRDFLSTQVPPKNPAATWVLCDVIRSMTPSFLPTFAPLLSFYEQWAADSTLNAKDRRSVESAIKKLKNSKQ